MGKVAEFFFDVGSPSSYLAWTQLPQICMETEATLQYRPMLLGGVYQATGNASPTAVPAKGRYVALDYDRYARRYGVPLMMNPHFPIITLFLMRVVTGVQLRHPDRFQSLLAAVFKALWIDALDLNIPELTASVLQKAGFKADDIDSLVNDPEVKAALKSNTEEAVSRGVFGAPSIFVGSELFFGQDRLEFVREALR